MSLPSENQLIVIIGAGTYIGRATAFKLAKQGARLALLDNVAEALREVYEACKDLSLARHIATRHIAVLMDVSDPFECEQFLSPSVIDNGIAHVFNCTGIDPLQLGDPSTIHEVFDRLYRTHVDGHRNVARRLRQFVIPGGSFITMGSICPGEQWMASYTATQHARQAVTGFSHYLAMDFESRGIRVNVVAPGIVNDPINSAAAVRPESVTETGLRLVIPRMTSPEEVAEAVAYMMSDQANSMDGHIVEVNGPTARVLDITTRSIRNYINLPTFPTPAGGEERSQNQ